MLTTSGTLTVSDVDTTDTVQATRTLAVTGTSDRTDPAAPTDAELLAMLTLNPTQILDGTQQSASLAWSFDSGSETFDYLATGENDDGTPLSDSETVTITITGTNDTPVITDGPDAAALTETDTTLSATGSVTVTDVDTTDTVSAAVSSVALSGTFTTSGSTLPNALGTSGDGYVALKSMLALDPVVGTAMSADTASSGTAFNWTFTSGASGDTAFDFLREGETLTLTYTLTLTDDSGVSAPQESPSATTTVAITVTGTNDTPVITVESGDSASESLTESNNDLGHVNSQ